MTREDFDEIDLAALDRALELSLADRDQEHAQAIRDRLKTDGWWEAASSAAYHRQFQHLSLMTWEEAPCHIDPDQMHAIISRGPTGNNAFGSAKLLEKMLAHNVSIYDPTPIDTLAARVRDA